MITLKIASFAKSLPKFLEDIEQRDGGWIQLANIIRLEENTLWATEEQLDILVDHYKPDEVVINRQMVYEIENIVENEGDKKTKLVFKVRFFELTRVHPEGGTYETTVLTNRDAYQVEGGKTTEVYKVS